MFGRVGHAWRLMRSCVGVLRQDPALVVPPLLAMVTCAFLFVLPGAAATASFWPNGNVSEGARAARWVVWMLLYVAVYFVAVFASAVVTAGSLERFRGGNPSLRDSFRAAAACTSVLVRWTVLAATVGMCLRFVESRSRLLGSLTARLFGMAWSVATFVVVPVLLVERSGPLDAIGRSTALLRATWGEQIAGRVSFGLPFVLLALPGVVVGLVYWLSWGTAPAPPWMALTVGYLVLLSAVYAALRAILAAAVYLQADGGVAPAPFQPDVLAAALRGE